MSTHVAKFFTSRKFEIAALIGALVISACAHSFNMFNYPYYENDEGIYMSQAWAVLTQGKLAHYTYWYDHAPLGWIQIALWTAITGGFHTFGFSINTGRVFMLVLHLASSVLLYQITKKFTNGNKIFSLLTVILFALSPLGIYFQRRVLLDNIMIFWVLLAIHFLLQYKNHLGKILYSAIALGIAILTKETAVVFIPVLLYYLIKIVDKRHRSFAVTQWLFIQGIIVSLYVLYAFIKGEFFPANSFLGSGQEHVSLIEAIFFQTNRSGGSILDPQNSEFWKSFNTVWSREDPILIYGGVMATLITAALGIFNLNARFLAALSGIFWIFLARGGFVIEFYILPLLPILALNISYSLWVIYDSLHILLHRKAIQKIIYAIPLVTLFFYINQFFELTPKVRGGVNMYTAQQTKSQLEAVEWIKKNRDPKDFIVIDNYAYIDLHSDPNKQFNNAEWYSKVDTDRDIRETKLNGDYTNIDYLAVTPQIEYDVEDKGLFLVGEAFKNSRQIVSYDNDFWRVRIMGALTPKRIAQASYESDKRQYIEQGRVEGIQNSADFLMRAVFQNDQNTFNEIYNTIKKNNQKENKLFADDQTTAPAQANTDIATALILAANKWQDAKYLDEAKEIVQALRQYSTVTLGKQTLIANSDNTTENTKQVILYTKNIMPQSYTLFTRVDNPDFWNNIKDTSYEILNSCTFTEDESILPPSICTLTLQNNGTITATPSSNYDQESYRVPIHIALDSIWTQDERARQYLAQLTQFEEEWTLRYQLGATYSQDGTVQEDYETVRSYSAAIAALSQTNQFRAREMWDLKLRDRFQEDANNSFWEDQNNIQNQTLSWYATSIVGELMTINPQAKTDTEN